MTIHMPPIDDRYTDGEIDAGAALLEEIHAKFVANGHKPCDMPPMGHPLGYMRGDNIRAVIVQERDGGWAADILFRDVPNGCPESLGTADASPLGTRRAARKAATKLVHRLLETPVPPEIVAWMMAGMPECGPPILIGNRAIFAGYRP
ncbi:MAG: hypothetical protein HUJ24_09655 [Rhodobacteraceae bacterium]|nr:hypothetical protein [Paracoccaceae bacterium]